MYSLYAHCTISLYKKGNVLNIRKLLRGLSYNGAIIVRNHIKKKNYKDILFHKIAFINGRISKKMTASLRVNPYLVFLFINNVRPLRKNQAASATSINEFISRTNNKGTGPGADRERT